MLTLAIWMNVWSTSVMPIWGSMATSLPDLFFAAELANLAAGIVVKKSGAATVTFEEMLLAIQQKNDNDNEVPYE